MRERTSHTFRRELRLPTDQLSMAHGRSRDVPSRLQYGSYRFATQEAALLRTSSEGTEPVEQLQVIHEFISGDQACDQGDDHELHDAVELIADSLSVQTITRGSAAQ